ncbi:HNH endonuclease [Rothia sp. 32237D007AR]
MYPDSYDIPKLSYEDFFKLHRYDCAQKELPTDAQSLRQRRSDNKYLIDPHAAILLYYFLEMLNRDYVESAQCNNFSILINKIIDFTDWFENNYPITTPEGSRILFKDYMKDAYERYRDSYVSHPRSYSNYGLCSYCKLSLANTWDHFIPKDKYPILATSQINLIPCCSECNSNIGEQDFGDIGSTLLHPYFLNVDLLEKIAFEIDTLHDVLAIKSYPPDSSTNNIDSANNHYRKLKLNEKYRAFLPSLVMEFCEHIHSLETLPNFSIDNSIEDLKRIYTNNRIKHKLLIDISEEIGKFKTFYYKNFGEGGQINVSLTDISGFVSIPQKVIDFTLKSEELRTYFDGSSHGVISALSPPRDN